jgi:large subunit ribosomal protein L4
MENTYTLKKFNLAGEEIGTVAVEERLFNAEANGQMIKDYIVALRANARQWSANTKTRAEVNRSKKKPHAQKGGGRARQGMRSAPQYKGGGRVFGPRPKFDQHVSINRKERRAAIRSLFGEKLRAGEVVILDQSEMAEPKTKTIASFLEKQNFSRRTLFLGEANVANIEYDEMSFEFNVASDKHENLTKSLRNIPLTTFSLATNVSGYDLVVAKNLVITEQALQQLVSWLC